MFSVGVLYSCRTLLNIIREDVLDLSNFERQFQRIDVADGSAVLSVSQQCQWLKVSDKGRLCLTERGQYLLSQVNEQDCLREQLLDLLTSAPPVWARRIIQGRFEALQAMPADAIQCFRECELTEGYDDITVDWWDQASQCVRSERSKVAHLVGRKAERLTLEYEERRTGREPLWQAIQTNVAGYDVLSHTNPDSDTRLMIEVKGSSLPRKQAQFFVTRNEWQTASKSKAYEFHLWLVHETPVLFVVPSEKLEEHIPTNQKDGRWESASFFFKHFAEFATS